MDSKNPAASSSGVIRGNSDTAYSESDYGQDVEYEQNYVVGELNEYARFESTAHVTENAGHVDGMRATHRRNNASHVYRKYRFGEQKTSAADMIPTDYFMRDIIRAVNNNNVVFIRGPTGCGKSTQVPQYILSDSKEKREFCNMVVTQPRKIATISSASRVCEERKWPLGSVCGYHVHLEKKVSSDTLLTYVTTGILLEQVLADKSLNRYSHIIIDDAHERDEELDFLLLAVRKFIFTNSSNTKVILMSASIEVKELMCYFNVTDSLIPPIVDIDISCYLNSIFYLEKTVNTIIKDGLTGIPTKFDIENPEISDEIWKIFVSLISYFDTLDASICPREGPVIGSTLVFLPGITDIEKAKKCLMEVVQNRKQKTGATPWEILILHSSLPNEEQAKVFKPIVGHRKIVLSTNIGESSITIPDCYYVIDFCQTKTMTIDPVTKNASLKLEWASHVNCEQRAGRAGRIGPGRVYRLVPELFYNAKMAERSTPEIIRAPLEKIVLQTKILDENQSPFQILSLALNPPKLRHVKNAVLSLKEMGGLLLTCKGNTSSLDGDLTFLGTVMAALPIDVRLSRLVVLGYLFGCLEEATIIAAGCTVDNIFQKEFNAYRKQLLWSDGSLSDFKTMLNIFTTWKMFTRDPPHANWDVRNWCDMNLINLKQLKEWDLRVEDIRKRLHRMNITGNGCTFYNEKSPVLDIIIAGAFYPNFFLKVPDEELFSERETLRIVDNRDPARTVYFTGMEPNQPYLLYTKAIKELLRNEEDGETDSLIGSNGSGKIYIKFKPIERKLQLENSSPIAHTSRPGKIPIEIYEAVRRRQLNHTFNLNLLSRKEASKWAKQNGVCKSRLENIIEKNANSATKFSPLPTLDIEWIALKITHHNEFGYFWAIRRDCEQIVIKIAEMLNELNLCPVPASDALKFGKIYAAKYHVDGRCYRCKIFSLDSSTALVIFVDYGNIEKVNLDNIYYIPNGDGLDIAPLAFECVLHGIQPSRKLNYNGVWDEKLYSNFVSETYAIWIYGKIHSVVDDVVYLELFKSNPPGCREKSINAELLERGIAEPAVESFLCKEDHESRRKVQEEGYPNNQVFRWNLDHIENYRDFKALKGRPKYQQTIELKGPHSPLEVRLHGCTSSSKKLMVVIDDSSVNTVLLDTEPRNIHTRLLVAANVSQTEHDHLKLRQTSMLPGIPGLPMLIALLFCPTMRIKLRKHDKRMASILCGLGYDYWENKPFHRSHDLILNVDTELSRDDIDKINDIRLHMNEGIKMMGEISRGRQEDMAEMHKYLQRNLRNLIYRPRKSLDRVYINSANNWKKKNSDALGKNIYGNMEIWAPLTC